MPKKKYAKSGGVEEMLEELAPTDDEGEGAPGKVRAATSKRKAAGSPNMEMAAKGRKKKEDNAAEARRSPAGGR